MGKYIRKVATEEAYQDFVMGDECLLPNVTLVEDGGTVHYNGMLQVTWVTAYNYGGAGCIESSFYCNTSKVTVRKGRFLALYPELKDYVHDGKLSIVEGFGNGNHDGYPWLVTEDMQEDALEWAQTLGWRIYNGWNRVSVIGEYLNDISGDWESLFPILANENYWNLKTELNKSK